MDAVHESFTHGVAHTSLIGGIIIAAGALIVLAVLPGRKAAAKHLQERTEGAQRSPVPARPQSSDTAGPSATPEAPASSSTPMRRRAATESVGAQPRRIG